MAFGLAQLSSPAGMLFTGLAGGIGSNLRRKRAIQFNRGIGEQEQAAVNNYYNSAIPQTGAAWDTYAANTRNLGNYSNSFFAGMPTAAPAPTIDPTAWLAANPMPTAPTMRDPSAIKFDPLLPRGARDAIRGKIGKKNQGKEDEYAAALSGWTQQRDAVRAAADKAAATPAPENLGDKTLAAYNERAAAIDKENQDLLDSVTGGYQKRYDAGMKELSGLTDQESKDIDTRYKAEEGRIVNDAINRGITGSTVLSSAQAGNAKARIESQRRLSDAATRERIALGKELSGDTLSAQRDLGKFKSLSKMQATQDALNNMDDQRKQALATALQTGQLANEAGRDAVAAKLGVSRDFLDSTIMLYEAQKQPVGEYSPLVNALGPATSAWTQREAQRQAAASRGFLGGSSDFGDFASLAFLGDAGVGALTGDPTMAMLGLYGSNYFRGV